MDVLEILKEVIHPEQQRDIVSLGMVERLTQDDESISFTLKLTKPRDPVAGSVKRAAEAMIYQQTGIMPRIIVEEPKPDKRSGAHRAVAEPEKIEARVIAIASGKGGVGKSTVTSNLAVALVRQGYRVGIIDADIYGPSMPRMFGVEAYVPVAHDETELIEPAESMGVKIMSIGFFVKPTDALVWRGPMATNALRQLIHQTLWGELDYLLIDLPPGTGDIHLSIVGQLRIDGAVIVSTPQRVALMDVVRGISMFRNDNVAVPILGLVCNMAYFTPVELPQNRYYIFGKGALEQVAQESGLDVLAEIPLVQSIAEAGDSGEPIASQDSALALVFDDLARTVVARL